INNDCTIEVVSGATTPGVDGDFATAASTLVLDHDDLPNTIGATNGTVLVETNAELQLTNVTSIDGGIITNHGEIEAVVGINTIKNVTGSNFTNNGTIEVVTGVAGGGAAPDTDPVNTLVLSNDYLTNSI